MRRFRNVANAAQAVAAEPAPLAAVVVAPGAVLDVDAAAVAGTLGDLADVVGSGIAGCVCDPL
jgi:hypothetical protein